MNRGVPVQADFRHSTHSDVGLFVLSTQGGHHENFLPGTQPQQCAHLSFRKRIEGLDEILAHQTGVFRNFFDAAMARCASVVDYL